MKSLVHRDWLALHEAGLDLNGTGDFTSLSTRILAHACALVPCDTVTFQDDRGGLERIPWLQGGQAISAGTGASWQLGVRAMGEWSPRFESLRDVFFEYSAEQHPHTAYYRRTGDGSARRLSDLMTLRELRGTRFYQEIAWRTHIRRQLTFYAPLPQGGTLMLAANRTATEFSDRDCTVFNLLGAQVAGVWRRAIERETDRARRDEWMARAIPEPFADDAASRSALRRLGMTPREAEVLYWLAQGKTNKEIEIILELSRSTVKTHLERIFGKLQCETRTAAARTALESMTN